MRKAWKLLNNRKKKHINWTNVHRCHFKIFYIRRVWLSKEEKPCKKFVQIWSTRPLDFYIRALFPCLSFKKTVCIASVSQWTHTSKHTKTLTKITIKTNAKSRNRRSANKTANLQSCFKHHSNWRIGLNQDSSQWWSKILPFWKRLWYDSVYTEVSNKQTNSRYSGLARTFVARWLHSQQKFHLNLHP